MQKKFAQLLIQLLVPKQFLIVILIDILLVKRLFFLLLVIYIFFSRDTNQQDRFLLHKNLLTAFILRTATYFIDYYTYLTLTDSLQVGCIMLKNNLFLIRVYDLFLSL